MIEQPDKERWKDVVGYEGLYQVSNLGRLHSIIRKGRVLNGYKQKIVESAIVFWFKDADCKAENKVVEYLGEY